MFRYSKPFSKKVFNYSKILNLKLINWMYKLIAVSIYPNLLSAYFYSFTFFSFFSVIFEFFAKSVFGLNACGS